MDPTQLCLHLTLRLQNIGYINNILQKSFIIAYFAYSIILRGSFEKQWQQCFISKTRQETQ